MLNLVRYAGVSLLLGKSSDMMYYVFVYCEFTLLIPLIDKLAKSKYKLLGFVVSPLEIIFMRLLPIVLGCSMNKYVSEIMTISCLGWFTYFYLGYLFGNDMLKVKSSISKLVLMYVGSIILQVLEGYWYFSMGESNCGTQLKLSAILSGVIFLLLAYKYINYEHAVKVKVLHILGDCSFGIYFAHLEVIIVLSKVAYYKQYVFFPVNAVVTVIITTFLVMIGRKVLGRYGKYFAL